MGKLDLVEVAFDELTRRAPAFGGPESRKNPMYIRNYVQNDPRCNPKARKFKVGEKVWFRQPDKASRLAIVSSHDRCYYRHRASRDGSVEGVDSYYTIRFADSWRTRKWVQATYLRRSPADDEKEGYSDV